MGDCSHRGQIGTGQPIRGLDDSGKVSVRGHSVRCKGFRQQRYLLKVQQDRIPMLVDAKVTGVRVGLGEY